MKLLDKALDPLPIRSIKPTGWLKRQLRIQADGLSGHIDAFWPDIKNSRWFGGTADGWERAPYWLDGAVPLAYQLEDKRLIDKIRGHIEYIISHQEECGWLGPRIADTNNPERSNDKYDIWAFFLAMKVLVQYHDITGDEKAFKAVEKCLKMMHGYIDNIPLFEWGRYRWFEALISIYYVHEKTGEDWLLDLARKLSRQGFNWKTFFDGEDVKVPTPRRGMWKWDKHVVNNAMAIKGYPLWWRVSGDEQDRLFSYRMMEILDQYHGQAHGGFSGDECLSGKNPLQGTELCAIADYMYSLELIISILGDPKIGDRLEKLAFNAFPATMSPDMWSHQYDQQANQAVCSINSEHLWSTNGPDSNIFGLEPNFGCCTANLHQAWPKFAAHLWMKTFDEGIAAVAYAPSVAKFTSHGIEVEVELETDYPFKDTLKFHVRPSSHVKFPILLRIPEWATCATLSVSGEKEISHPAAGTFFRLEREWKGSAQITLKLPMRFRSTRRYNNALSLERGPLVYALKIGEEWRQVNENKPGREKPHADYEVHPTTPWNYALDVNESDLESSITVEERPVGECPFSPDGAPVRAFVNAQQVPWWKLRNGWAYETPISPVNEATPIEKVELIPYGCTNLRIAEFPTCGK